jgi:ATP-dependent Clp protease ATP-binding subunit ClpC
MYLARRLAAFLFGDENALVWLDMADFREKHSLADLCGHAGGFAPGCSEGRLTEAVRCRPYSIVLLQDIDRAHPDVWGLLAHLLDQGRLTDGLGRLVDFRRTLLVLTTTLGSEELAGVKPGHGPGWAVEERVREVVRTLLPREYLERLDEVIVFRPLSNDALGRCVDLEVSQVVRRLAERGLELVLTDDARRWLSEECAGLGNEPHPARRAVERLLIDPLSEELLRGTFPERGILIARLSDTGSRKSLVFDSIIAGDSPELTSH